MNHKFADYSTRAEGFPSSWKKTRTALEVGSQTDSFNTADAECQVVSQTNFEMQTDADLLEVDGTEVNDFKVLAFLQRVEPAMTEQLEANLHSHAFHGYQLIDDEGEEKVRCQLELRWLEQKQLSVRDVTWNAAGSVVAAAFGVLEHTTWCNHTGAVTVWGIHRSDLKPSEPTFVLNVDKCVTSAAFHPTEPALIAGGALNGEVYLWDLSWSEVGSPGVSSGSAAGGHEEAITALRWVKAEVGLGGAHLPYHRHLLVSSGSDGKVLLWKVSPLSQEMKLLKKLILRNSDIPVGLEQEITTEFEVGVSAVGFSTHDSAQFLAGGEGGNVLLCSTVSQTSAAGVEGFYNPITLAFLSHDGQVSDVQWCPHHPKLFLTCSTDGQIRVYSTQDEQAEPSLVLNMEHGVGRIAWSTVAPLVVAAGTSDGQVHFFNLKTTKDKPIVVLPNKTSAPITGLVFNNKNPNVIAVGDASGRVTIWKIHRDILTAASTDSGYLKDLAQDVVD